MNFAQERLIVALNLPSADEASKVVDELGEIVSFYKIGLQLQFDPKLRRLCRKLLISGKDIFLDFKYIDIPATIESVVRAVSELDIKFITVMGQAHIVEAAAKGRGGSGLKILAVTLLTAMNEEDMRRAYNTTLSLDQFVVSRAREAINAGCDGLISSPQEIRLIRNALGGKSSFLIVTPGIRPRGSPKDDQKRVSTPYDAIFAGADYLVVGRPITHNAERQRVAKKIIDQMGEALVARKQLGYPPTSASPRSSPSW